MKNEPDEFSRAGGRTQLRRTASLEPRGLREETMARKNKYHPRFRVAPVTTRSPMKTKLPGSRHQRRFAGENRAPATQGTAMSKRNRPSFGRPKAERGLDLFDTPVIALAPLFEHEPLLSGVKSVCEPFCGKGSLVLGMRARGIRVHASDIQDRGCPNSRVLDFLAMTRRPKGCDTLISNCAYDGAAGGAMEFIEHALAIEFRLIVLLLKLQFLCTEERYERLHPLGHLRRVHVFAERIPDMHDAAHLAKGGKKAAPSRKSRLVRYRPRLLRPARFQHDLVAAPNQTDAMGERSG